MESINKTILLIAVISTLTFGCIAPARASGTAVITINPSGNMLSHTQVGETFKVNITINNVTNLWDWKVRVNWDPQILNLTNVEEGPFLKSGGATLFLWPEGAPQIKDGYIPEIYCALLSSGGVTGSGVLATLTFKVLRTGSSPILLNETWLNTFSGSIAHIVTSGYVVIPMSFSAFGQEILVSSNSTITNFQFSSTSKKISFSVSGSTGTKGFANITFPRSLLSGDLTVYLNGTPLVRDVNYTLVANATHYGVNLNYLHSTHQVEIIGTEAIPEFPDMAILMIGMLAIAAVLIILKKPSSYSAFCKKQ